MNRLFRSIGSIFLPEVVNPNDPVEEERQPSPVERVLMRGCVLILILIGVAVGLVMLGVIFLSPADFGVTSVAYRPDGTQIAAALASGQIVLLDAASGERTGALDAHSGVVWQMAYSTAGDRLFSAGEDGKVVVWDLASGTPLQVIQPYRYEKPAEGAPTPTLGGLVPIGDYYAVNTVAPAPDGTLLALAADQHGDEILIYDATTGERLRALPGHAGNIWALDISPDGRWLAAASAEDIVTIQDMDSGAVRLTLDGPKSGSLEWLATVAFSPDGTLVASAGTDQDVYVWDTSSGALKHRFSGHTDWINTLAFQPGGTLLLSGADDRSVRLWDLAIDREIDTLERLPGKVKGVAWSPDGAIAAIGTQDGTLTLWNVTTGARTSIDVLE